MKRNNRKYFVACLTAFFALVLALPGYSASGTLQVKCVDASGSPVQNAKVSAFSMNAAKAKDKKSDAQGIAEFAKIDDGVYRVIGRKEGFAPSLYEFVSLKENTQSVTLTFTAGADKKLYFEDPAEEQRAATFLQQGLDAAKQSKYADAEKLFLQSLEIKPSGAETLYYYGVTFVQMGKFEQAAEKLRQAVQIADMLKAVQNASAPNSYEAISQGAARLLKQMPALRGENALRQKNYELAIKEFSTAIKDDPGDPESFANLAIAQAYSGLNDEALVTIEKAIQLKPAEKSYTDLKSKIAARRESALLEKAQALMIEGNKMLQDGDAAAALKKYEEANRMVAADKQAPLWRQIARAQAKLNQEAAAIASYKKSLELAPADKMEEYKNAFAQFYIDGKKYEDAINLLADPKLAGSKSPEQILSDLAKTWKNKEPVFAIAALEKVIKLNPENAEAYFELGQLFYIEGKAKDSRTKELLTKFLEIGKDAEKIQGAKDILVIVNKRSK